MVVSTGLSDRFAICTWEREGKLVLGGGDSRLHHGVMKYVPFLPPYHQYYVRVYAVMVGEEDIIREGEGVSGGGTTASKAPLLRRPLPPVEVEPVLEEDEEGGSLPALIDTGSSEVSKEDY